MKALVRERIKDWKARIEGGMGKKSVRSFAFLSVGPTGQGTTVRAHLFRRVVELTGDMTPDVRSIQEASVIVTTPEKWDGISRSWQNRSYVKDVALVVIDEIHLLGELIRLFLPSLHPLCRWTAEGK